MRALRRALQGRPFTGAWIETKNIRMKSPCSGGRPFTGAWIETQGIRFPGPRPKGRPFTGAWIETPLEKQKARQGVVAPSRGRGLKLLNPTLLGNNLGSPLHGGVD